MSKNSGYKNPDDEAIEMMFKRILVWFFIAMIVLGILFLRH